MLINSTGRFNALSISTSALKAQRARLDVIASNMANSETTRTSEGGPYKRQTIAFESMLHQSQGSSVFAGSGVRVSSIGADNRPPITVHLPEHPDADVNGNVQMPDIRPAEEMADLLTASRAYEANAAAFKISRSVFQKALELGRI